MRDYSRYSRSYARKMFSRPYVARKGLAFAGAALVWQSGTGTGAPTFVASGWLVLLVFMLAGCHPLVGPLAKRTASPTTSPATLTHTPFPVATPTLIPSLTTFPTQRPQSAATATRTPTPARRSTATRSPTGTPPATIGPFLLYPSDSQPAGEVTDPRAAPDGVLWVNTHRRLGQPPQKQVDAALRDARLKAGRL